MNQPDILSNPLQVGDVVVHAVMVGRSIDIRVGRITEAKAAGNQTAYLIDPTGLPQNRSWRTPKAVWRPGSEIVKAAV